MGARQKDRKFVMSKQQKQYKISVAEAATKGARMDRGGATARAWCVIRIDTGTGDKQTAAQIITAAALRAADKDAARRVKDMSRACGGVYARRTAAILAAARAVDMLGAGHYLDARIDVDAAQVAEAEYIAAAAAMREAARARRLERMTPEQRAAAERRAAIKAIRNRAAAEIAALKGTAR